MAEWTTKYPVNFTPTGDTTSQAIEKHINEFGEVYTLLNRVRKHDADTTAPTDPVIGHRWVNTGKVPYEEYYWDGTKWIKITRDVKKITEDYTTQLGDNVLLVDASNGAITITLTNGDYVCLCIKKIDDTDNAITVVPSGGNIDGQASITISYKYDSYTLICDGTDWWIL